MGKTLFIVASAMLAGLGLLHGLLAVHDLGRPSFFTPTDRDVRDAMARARLRVAPQTSIWLAWQGFNVSHNLGLLGLGLTGMAVGAARATLQPWHMLVHGFFVIVSAVYFVLAVRFWFRAPAIGFGIATGCFIVATFFD